VRCKGISTVDLKFGLAAEESGTSLSSVNYVDADAKVLTGGFTFHISFSYDNISCEYYCY